MAIVLAPVFASVLSAVRGIRSQAGQLQALPASFSFDQLMRPMDQMGLGIQSVQAFLAKYTDAAVVQAAADKANLDPATTTGIRTKLVAVDTAHTALANAYATIYAGAGNLITFSATPPRVHGYVTVQLTSVASLGTLLASLVTACDALAYEG